MCRWRLEVRGRKVDQGRGKGRSLFVEDRNKENVSADSVQKLTAYRLIRKRVSSPVSVTGQANLRGRGRYPSVGRYSPVYV